MDELKHKQIIVLKNRIKKKNEATQELNITYFGDLKSSFGVFTRKITAFKRNDNVIRSPFHNPLLHSLKIHNQEVNHNQSDIQFKEIHFKRTRAKSKNYNHKCVESEEDLIKNALIKRKAFYPRFLMSPQNDRTNTQMKESPNKTKKKVNPYISAEYNSKTYMSKVKHKINESTKKILGNILEVRKIPFNQFHKPPIHKKYPTCSLINEMKPFQIPVIKKPRLLSNNYEINDDFEYLPIKSVFYRKEKDSSNNMSL